MLFSATSGGDEVCVCVRVFGKFWVRPNTFLVRAGEELFF